MKYLIYVAACCFFISLSSCEEEMSEEEIRTIGVTSCRRLPVFSKNTGLIPNRTAYSTEGTRKAGILMIEIPANPNDTISKTYQHPSWSQHGYMGSVSTDDFGNAYTYPIPVVNTLNLTPEKLNTIYKIDYHSGELATWLKLPMTSVDKSNPYGLLGIYFDCHGKKIYASSVMSSSSEAENGIIYVIDPATNKVIDQLENVDAMGLAVVGIDDKKKLFIGSARTPHIQSIELTKEGKFKGKLQYEATLDLLGPRGDDRARKIRFDKNRNMIVHGVEFNFSLAAQSEKPETVYRFSKINDEGKWKLLDFH